VSREEQERQAVTDRNTGALLLRDAGSAADTRWIDSREDLPRLTGVPLLGVIPAGAGALPPHAFQSAAPGWIVGDVPGLTAQREWREGAEPPQ